MSDITNEDPKRPRVLALDLARRRTGIAAWNYGLTKPRCFYIDLPQVDEIGIITTQLEEKLMPFHHMIAATHWVYEAPMIVHHKDHNSEPCKVCGRSANGSVNIHEIERTLGLTIIVRHLAKAAGVQVSPAYRSRVVKHFTGMGNGTSKEMKTRCLLHCQAKGWKIDDHNIADACAILDWWLWENRIPDVGWNCMPGTPLFANVPVAASTDLSKARADRAINPRLSFDRGRG